MSTISVNQNETVKEQENVITSDDNDFYTIYSADNELIYKTSKEELDECFFNILALASYSKTFNVGDGIKLTFSSISNETKKKLLKDVQTWADVEKPAPNLFQEELNKYNLAYYLAYVEINGSVINVREKTIEDRLIALTQQDEAALRFYGTYLYVFMQIINKALLSKATLKN